MLTAVRSSAPERVAGTHGLRPGRSAGQQSGLGSCSSGCRSWTDAKIWVKPTNPQLWLLLGRLAVADQRARAACHAAHMLGHAYPASHLSRSTYSDMHTLHAIHFAAHLRPIYHPTENAPHGRLSMLRDRTRVRRFGSLIEPIESCLHGGAAEGHDLGLGQRFRRHLAPCA